MSTASNVWGKLVGATNDFIGSTSRQMERGRCLVNVERLNRNIRLKKSGWGEANFDLFESDSATVKKNWAVTKSVIDALVKERDQYQLRADALARAPPVVVGGGSSTKQTDDIPTAVAVATTSEGDDC